MVGVRGFEPPIPRPPAECSTRLSHTPLYYSMTYKEVKIGKIDLGYIQATPSPNDIIFCVVFHLDKFIFSHENQSMNHKEESSLDIQSYSLPFATVPGFHLNVYPLLLLPDQHPRQFSNTEPITIYQYPLYKFQWYSG